MAGELHVVVGAGPLGRAVVRAQHAAGKRVRVVTRSGRVWVPDGVEVMAADATDPAAARRACQGAAVVYHCAATPYATWPQTLPAIMDGIITGAGAADARLVYGDNLYCYGPVTGPLTEDLPWRASGPNGGSGRRWPRRCWRRTRPGRWAPPSGAPATSSARRCGSRSWGTGCSRQPWPAARPMPHTYSFMDDTAAALLVLAEREAALGEVWHVPNAETLTTRRVVELVFQQAGTAPRLRVAPKLGILAVSLVNPTMRAVRERLYQTQRPFVVDHSKYERAFGAAPTPTPEAIGRTLDWYRSSGS